MAPTQDAVGRPPVVNRWVQLVAGIVAMMAIANLQYAWTLFTTPLTENLNTTLPMVQWAFAGFILAETWLSPLKVTWWTRSARASCSPWAEFWSESAGSAPVWPLRFRN